MSRHVHDEKEFADVLTEANAQNRLVFVKFTGAWCAPCKAVAPTYDALAKRLSSHADFLSVDINELEDVATSFQVRSIPAFHVIENLKEIDKWLGGDKNTLKKKVAQHLREAQE